MHDCVGVTHATHVAPVATALQCCAKLATTLVTDTRAAALACLDYVTQHKAGCLKCLIVEEHKSKGNLEHEQENLIKVWKEKYGAVRLSECLEVRLIHTHACNAWTWFFSKRCDFILVKVRKLQCEH